MQDSVFTKIIKGEIPCHKVYEDDLTIAFMDIQPVQPGMVLVVPKIQVDNFEDLDDTYYSALWDSVKKVASSLRINFPDKKKIAVQVEGLDVPHAHVKLFPIDNAADFRAMPETMSEPDHAKLSDIAEKLKI